MFLVWVPAWVNPLEPELHSFFLIITLIIVVIAIRQVPHYDIQSEGWRFLVKFSLVGTKRIFLYICSQL